MEQECSLAAEAKYPASRLYENYRHYCQILGRKPQSNSAFKKALDKLVNVYQSRSSSGMQWHGIKRLMQVEASISVVCVGILENFLQNFLWGLFGFAYPAYTTYTILSLL